MIKFLKEETPKYLTVNKHVPLITAFKDNYDARLRKSQILSGDTAYRRCVHATPRYIHIKPQRKYNIFCLKNNTRLQLP